MTSESVKGSQEDLRSKFVRWLTEVTSPLSVCDPFVALWYVPKVADQKRSFGSRRIRKLGPSQFVPHIKRSDYRDDYDSVEVIEDHVPICRGERVDMVPHTYYNISVGPCGLKLNQR